MAWQELPLARDVGGAADLNALNRPRGQIWRYSLVRGLSVTTQTPKPVIAPLRAFRLKRGAIGNAFLQAPGFSHGVYDSGSRKAHPTLPHFASTPRLSPEEREDLEALHQLGTFEVQVGGQPWTGPQTRSKA